MIRQRIRTHALRRMARRSNLGFDPSVIITQLCIGPATAWELARTLHTRPTCLRVAIRTLLKLKLIRRERRPESGIPYPGEPKLMLALDPILCWAMITASVQEPKIIPKKSLHGSLEYLHTQDACLNGQTPPSNSPPVGVPMGGPAQGEHKL
jgi:hypothetical protein